MDGETVTAAADNVVRLSSRSAKVYEAILAWFCATGGAPPSHRELMERCGISSVSVVAYHLRRLADVGLICFAPGASRSVMLVGARWTPPPPVRIDLTDTGRQSSHSEQLRRYWSDAQRKSRAAKRAFVPVEVDA